MRVIAIDWSGRVARADQSIWAAEADGDQLTLLRCGLDRDQIARWLIDEAARDPHLVVGLDFAFSLPEWYLHASGLTSAPALWAGMHDGLAETLLRGCEPPFWGRAGKRRPPGAEQFRVTDRAHSVGGIRPKSVFQVGGAGAVGTGSLRGMSVLHRLHGAGFRVWPFCDDGWPKLVEIYPRLLTGPVRKSRPAERQSYLASRCPKLDAGRANVAGSTEDAFDAAVSALSMRMHASEFEALAPASNPQLALEGIIWAPDHRACGC